MKMKKLKLNKVTRQLIYSVDKKYLVLTDW